MKTAELFDVSGKVAIVTGGASGIGRAYAQAMADNGARVVLLDRDATSLDRALTEMRDRGGDVSGRVLDVSQRDDVREAIDDSARDCGGLDILFANAGIGGGPGFMTLEGARNPEGAFEDIADALWDRVMETNLSSVFACIRAAIPHMRERGGGRIIVTSSIAALRPSPISGIAYPVTKIAVAHLVKQAALELARFGITVNAILPGPFKTSLMTAELDGFARRSNPMHRAASTDEIQGLALFLASSASSFVTGAHLVIDGGQSLGQAD